MKYSVKPRSSNIDQKDVVYVRRATCICMHMPELSTGPAATAPDDICPVYHNNYIVPNSLMLVAIVTLVITKIQITVDQK